MFFFLETTDAILTGYMMILMWMIASNHWWKRNPVIQIVPQITQLLDSNPVLVTVMCYYHNLLGQLDLYFLISTCWIVN